MPCHSCIETLAYKLLKHHPKLDLIRAMELAEKGVQRYENKKTEPNIKTGNPTDYTQACTNCGYMCNCYLVETCTNAVQCRDAFNCVGKGCCPPPLPNSHQSSVCSANVVPTFTCNCISHLCQGLCTCTAIGTCGYDCDTGYVWNPVTLQCEPGGPTGEARGDGYYFIDTG